MVGGSKMKKNQNNKNQNQDSKLIELNTEEKKSETFEHLHGPGVTRRDFLASGLIPFSASLFMPSYLNIFAKSGVAEAQEIVCKSASALDLCPFISIKLSGGAAMSANFLPHDQGLQPLPSYSKMGMGKAGNFNIVQDFSNKAPFYELSNVLIGIRSAADSATLNKASFVGMPVRSADDSANNKFDITGLVAKSGLNGKILPNLGKANTVTGVNNLPAYIAPPSPLIVSSYDAIVGALGVSGALSNFSKDQKAALFRSVASMTASQSAKLQNVTGGATLTRLLQCANQDNSKLISNANGLDTDPLSNAAFAAIWGINNNTSKTSQDFVFASMVYNALNGNAGTVNLEIGGYDYHNNTRTSGDAKDNEAGVVIGRVLQSMSVMNKKGFIMVTSDGSVSSPDSDSPGGPWGSDRGIAGCAYMIGFDPAGAHAVKKFQVGHFTSGQAADDSFITGAGPEIAGGGIFANYLAFNGKLNLINNYLPRVFESHDLDKIVVFS